MACHKPHVYITIPTSNSTPTHGTPWNLLFAKGLGCCDGGIGGHLPALRVRGGGIEAGQHGCRMVVLQGLAFSGAFRGFGGFDSGLGMSSMDIATHHCATSPAECDRIARPWHRVPAAHSAARPHPSGWDAASVHSASPGMPPWPPVPGAAPPPPLGRAAGSADGAAPWWAACRWHSPSAPAGAATPPEVMAATFQRRLLKWFIRCQVQCDQRWPKESVGRHNGVSGFGAINQWFS